MAITIEDEHDLVIAFLKFSMADPPKSSKLQSSSNTTSSCGVSITSASQVSLLILKFALMHFDSISFPNVNKP